MQDPSTKTLLMQISQWHQADVSDLLDYLLAHKTVLHKNHLMKKVFPCV